MKPIFPFIEHKIILDPFGRKEMCFYSYIRIKHEGKYYLIPNYKFYCLSETTTELQAYQNFVVECYFILTKYKLDFEFIEEYNIKLDPNQKEDHLPLL